MHINIDDLQMHMPTDGQKGIFVPCSLCRYVSMYTVMYATVTKYLCAYICIIVLLFTFLPKERINKIQHFWIDWTAPAGMGSDYEPWHTLHCLPGISCHFFRQDKVTQIDDILITWQGQQVLQISLMGPRISPFFYNTETQQSPETPPKEPLLIDTWLP